MVHAGCWPDWQPRVVVAGELRAGIEPLRQIWIESLDSGQLSRHWRGKFMGILVDTRDAGADLPTADQPSRGRARSTRGLPLPNGSS
jgi:hypothetical protein